MAYPKTPEDVAKLLCEGAPGPWIVIVNNATADPNQPFEDVVYRFYEEEAARKRAASAWKYHNMGAGAVKSVRLEHGEYVEEVPNPAGPPAEGDGWESDQDPMVADQLDFGQHVKSEFESNNMTFDMRTNRVTDLENGYSFEAPTRLWTEGGGRYEIVKRVIELALDMRKMDIRFEAQ